MSAAFTFDTYKLIELAYKQDLDSDPAKKSDGTDVANKEKKYNIRLASSIAVKREKVIKYRMELKVDVTGSMSATIRLYGFFSSTGFYDNNDTEQSELSSIGIALLLPIARSILACISAQDGSAPFLIPTVNVTEFLSNASNNTSD